MNSKEELPTELKDAVSWRFVVNGERCVKCGACAMDCPVQIIVEEPQQFLSAAAASVAAIVMRFVPLVLLNVSKLIETSMVNI